MSRASGGEELARPAVEMGGTVGRPAAAAWCWRSRCWPCRWLRGRCRRDEGRRGGGCRQRLHRPSTNGSTRSMPRPTSKSCGPMPTFPAAPARFLACWWSTAALWMSGHRSHMARISQPACPARVFGRVHQLSAGAAIQMAGPDRGLPLGPVLDSRPCGSPEDRSGQRRRAGLLGRRAVGGDAGRHRNAACSPQPPANADRDGAAGAKEVLRLKAVVAGGAPCDFRWLPRGSSGWRSGWAARGRKNRTSTTRPRPPNSFRPTPHPSCSTTAMATPWCRSKVPRRWRPACEPRACRPRCTKCMGATSRPFSATTA